LGVDVDIERFKNMKAEIQVRTHAQHISADALHDRMYKTIVKPLPEHFREAARLNAAFEIADTNLAHFIDKFDRFSLNQMSYLSVKKIEDELQILQAVNFGESHLFKNILAMAGYWRLLGQYHEAEALLTPYISDEKNGILILDTMQQTRLWFEYGISLHIDNNKKLAAQKWIKKALDNYKWLEQEHHHKGLEARRFYIFMLLPHPPSN
jgi:tetratricopeptide (TPR) repeat protein